MVVSTCGFSFISMVVNAREQRQVEVVKFPTRRAVVLLNL